MDHARSELLVQAVENIYASALDGSGLVSALRTLNEGMDGLFSQSFSFERASGKVLGSQVSNIEQLTGNEEYAREWGHRDPRNPALAKLASLDVVRCQEICDEKFVSRSPFHQEYLIPMGYRWGIGGAIHFDNGTSTVIASVRAPDQRAFSEDDALFLRRLLPHFSRSIRLHEGLSRRRECAVRDILDQSSRACALVDAAGRVHGANERCFALVQSASHGVCLRNGAIYFADPGAQQLWASTLTQAFANRSAQTLSIRHVGKDLRFDLLPWILTGKARDSVDQRLVLVTIGVRNEVAQRSTKVASMAARADLSQAETQVLSLLEQGLVIKQIAARRGCSANTVRTQLAAIMTKTGMHSQRQLLAALAS